MERPLLNARFYDTDHFVSQVHDILADTESHLQLIHDFNCDGQHFAHSVPFPPYSAFHCFLEHVIRDLLTQSTEELDLDERKAILQNYKDIPAAIEDLDPCTLPIEEALRSHGLDYEVFTDWLKDRGKAFSEAEANDIYEYMNDLLLGEAFDSLLIQSVREAFYVLFGNRGALTNFNHMMAMQFTMHADEEIPEEFASCFSKRGALRRVSLPEWVKRSVFFRDRGRCVACNTDLTGLVTIWSEDHYDHVIPLAAGV